MGGEWVTVDRRYCCREKGGGGGERERERGRGRERERERERVMKCFTI